MAIAAKVAAAIDSIDAAYAGSIHYTTRSPRLDSENALPLLIASSASAAMSVHRSVSGGEGAAVAPFSPAKPQAVRDQEAFGFLFSGDSGSGAPAIMRGVHDDGVLSTVGERVHSSSSGMYRRGHTPSRTIPTLDTYLSTHESNIHRNRHHDPSNSSSNANNTQRRHHSDHSTFSINHTKSNGYGDGVVDVDAVMSRSEKVADALRYQYYADKAEERTFYELQSYLTDVRRRKEAQREDLLANHNTTIQLLRRGGGGSNSASREGSTAAVGHLSYRDPSSYRSIAATDRQRVEGMGANEHKNAVLLMTVDGVEGVSQPSNNRDIGGVDGDSLRAVSVATTEDPFFSSSSHKAKQGPPIFGGESMPTDYGDNPFLTSQQRLRLQRWRSGATEEDGQLDRALGIDSSGGDAEETQIVGRSPSPSNPDRLPGDANTTSGEGRAAAAAAASVFDKYDVFAPHVSAENARRQSRAAHIQNNASLPATILDALSAEESEMRESIIRYWGIAMRQFHYDFSTHPKTVRLLEQRLSVGLPSTEKRARRAILAEEAEAFSLCVICPFYRGEAPPYLPPVTPDQYAAAADVHSYYSTDHYDHTRRYPPPPPPSQLIQQQLITYTIVNPHYRGAMFLWLLQPLERSEMVDRLMVEVAATRRAQHLFNVFVEEGRLLEALYGGATGPPSARGTRYGRPSVSHLLGRSGGASSPSSPPFASAIRTSGQPHHNPSSASASSPPPPSLRSMLWHYATHDRLDPLEATPEETAHVQHERRLTESAYGLLARHRAEEATVLLGQLQRHHGAARQRLVWEEEAAFEALIASPLAVYLREERQWALYASSEGPAQSLVRSVFGRDTAMQREHSSHLRY